jgi:hypothetical protein
VSDVEDARQVRDKREPFLTGLFPTKSLQLALADVLGIEVGPSSSATDIQDAQEDFTSFHHTSQHNAEHNTIPLYNISTLNQPPKCQNAKLGTPSCPLSTPRPLPHHPPPSS